MNADFPNLFEKLNAYNKANYEALRHYNEAAAEGLKKLAEVQLDLMNFVLDNSAKQFQGMVETKDPLAGQAEFAKAYSEKATANVQQMQDVMGEAQQAFKALVDEGVTNAKALMEGVAPKAEEAVTPKAE